MEKKNDSRSFAREEFIHEREIAKKSFSSRSTGRPVCVRVRSTNVYVVTDRSQYFFFSFCFLVLVFCFLFASFPPFVEKMWSLVLTSPGFFHFSFFFLLLVFFFYLPNPTEVVRFIQNYQNRLKPILRANRKWCKNFVLRFRPPSFFTDVDPRLSFSPFFIRRSLERKECHELGNYANTRPIYIHMHAVPSIWKERKET